MLYRKYRSQAFSDLSGQDWITQSLRNAVKHDRFGHAYIFTGPRGTGKTSTARILAKAVNCSNAHKKGEPCNKCDICMEITQGKSVDIIEIDAASNTSVDDVRDLIEKVEFSPINSKYKVYIVDEVHMLSKSAFNALLKTLEEPPRHVIFVLATTEIHKVPVTILSRCQRFDFRLGGSEEVIDLLKKTTKEEGVVLEDEVYTDIFSMSGGSYRDAMTVLDQVLSNASDLKKEKIKRDDVRQVLGMPSNVQVISFVESLIEGNAANCIEIIDKLRIEGIDPTFFVQSVLEEMRSRLKSGLLNRDDISSIFRKIKVFSGIINEIKLFPMPFLPIEIAVIEICGNIEERSSIVSTKVNHGHVVGPRKKSKMKFASKKTVKEEKTEPNPKKKKPKGSVRSDDEISKLLKDSSHWARLLDALKPHNGHLSAFMSKATVNGVEEGELVLKVPFEFYQERIEDVKSQEIIIDEVDSVLDASLSKVRCIVETVTSGRQSVSDVVGEEELLEDALEVFGDDVV